MKMKRMFHSMNSSGEKLVKYLKTKTEEEEEVVNIEDALSKFTMDFTSTGTFGWENNTFENKLPTLFEKMAFMLRIDTARLVFQFVVDAVCPSLASFFGCSIFPMKAQKFFRNLVVNSIRVREKNKDEKHDDFLQLMLELRDEQTAKAENESQKLNTASSTPEIPLEDVDIAAHCMSLFTAGFESVRNALQHAAYNLALSPEVQERLFQELKHATAEKDGVINYEIVNGLKYLNAVISESLRVFPVASGTMRTCTKDFYIPDTSIKIPKGAAIVIPTGPIQLDQDYFPNPKKFDPERFLPENRSNIQSGTYMPFGQGPRICVGTKFALIEIKTAVAHLLLNFKLEPCEKTQIPMKFASNSITSKPQGGVWLRLKPRPALWTCSKSG